MPAKRSNIICPNCKRVGGALSISWSKEQSGVPNISSIRTIADAFDAVGKMYLNLTNLSLLLPYPDENYIFYAIFPVVSEFFPYDQNKLNEIINDYFQHPRINAVLKSKSELLKKNVIENLDKRVTDSPYSFLNLVKPETIGKITKSCIAFLCYALVCFSISDLFKTAPFSINGDLKHAHAIYHFHKTLLPNDRRNSPHIFQWMDLLSDSSEHGNHAAASMNKYGMIICKKCSKLNTTIKKYVFFENIKNDKGGYVLQCSTCGSQELLQKKLITGDYLKKIKERKVIEIQNFNDSVDLNEKLVKKCANYIKNSDVLIHNFKRNEEKFLDGNLGRKEYYSIGHYNPKNKNKKCCRFSDLSQVKLDNPLYIIYQTTISILVDKVISLNRNTSANNQLQKIQYKNSMYDLLNKIEFLQNWLVKALHFPRKFCEQKIQSDLISVFQEKRFKTRS
jgi:hypothetical protein